MMNAPGMNEPGMNESGPGTDASPPGAGSVVCRIVGDLDLDTVGAARAALDRALASRAPVLVVDLSGVGFCDSSGLNLLLQARYDAEAAGVTIRLAALASAVARVFELTGMAAVFSIHTSAEEAVRF